MLVCKGYCSHVGKTVFLDIVHKCRLLTLKTVFEAIDFKDVRSRDDLGRRLRLV